VLDDGSGEQRLVLTIGGSLWDGQQLPDARVPAGDFAGMGWVLGHWGCRAIVNAGQGAKDNLRAAIQTLSTPARHVVFQHTGWRKVDQHWLYLHAGGAIGQGDAGKVLVDLAPPLDRFRLPPPPAGADLLAALRADLDLLNAAPLRITVPLLGGVYRAALGGEPDCAINAVGHTGQGKSELAALGQQHYGPTMNRLNLPACWASTANALEALAFLCKDAVLVIDDFKPQGGRGEVEQLHAKADRIFRGQGNRSGRQRCRTDGTPRPARPPRGLILSTGEDVPRGESLRARQLLLQVGKGDIDVTRLTPYQQAGVRGLYAQAMAAFLARLAPHYDQVRTALPAEYATLRARALAADGHPRTPGVVADLALGLNYFLGFAKEAGAITAAEEAELWGKGWAALLEAAAEQAADIAGQDPARRFLRLLAAVLSSGRAHLAARDGGEPEGPASCGWRLEGAGPANVPAGCWRPQGRLVGWLDGDDVFLDPESAYAEAQRLGGDQGEQLTLSQRQLHKRLNESGLLASREGKKLTTRRTLQGAERPVLHLVAGALISG
jgi:hypothetical protein